MFNSKNLIIFDMEVTKFLFDQDVLVQFAARKYVANRLVDKLDILVNNPNTVLSESFIKRTRITPNLLKTRGISYEAALTKIASFIQDETIVTYKGNFYYLKMLWYILGRQLPNPTIDIIDIAKEHALVANPDDLSLADLAQRLGLYFDPKKWHNASYDVSIIEKIWFKLKATFKHQKE